MTTQTISNNSNLAATTTASNDNQPASQPTDWLADQPTDQPSNQDNATNITNTSKYKDEHSRHPTDTR
eukprot:15464124-Alexandrium_andersonii.AAC.1